MTHSPHDRIAAELAALGEDPADDEELALASPGQPVHDDVRTVATLVALSQWQPPAKGLEPLERHRVWQRVAARIAAPVADPHEAAANGGGATGWRGVVASLALVAGVVLVLHVDVAPPPSAEDRAALQSAGEAARAVLEGTLPGEQDGARVKTLAQGYQARLRAVRGADR